MSNLKVVHGAQTGPESHRPDLTIDSASHPNHTDPEPNKAYAHDETPARQREFESQGYQTRAMVEGEHGDSSPSSQSDSRMPGARAGNNFSGVGERGNDFSMPFSAGAGLSGSHAQERQSQINQPGSSLNFKGSLNFQAGGNPGLRPGAEYLFTNTQAGVKQALAETVRTVSEQLQTVGSNARNNSSPLGEHASNYAKTLISSTSYAWENRLSYGNQPDPVAREMIANVVSISQLGKYFSVLEKAGGEPARQAYRMAMSFLLASGRGGAEDRLQLATDLLRDLQGGLFLYREDRDGPFPLTGRARVVSEMIALMRTLDALEAAAEGSPAGRNNGALATIGLAAGDLAGPWEQLLADGGPMLPGLAGRLEIARMLSAQAGLLNDAKGNPLLMVDGKPLRVGDLLWLNTLTNSSSWPGDTTGSRLSPALVYGFDSIFSLIGFDGRGLSLPRFLAVQSQVNAFEFDWVFGETLLSESWMRQAIELLKDSRLVDHNVLGEMLEEALTNGRFHMAVMRGTVEEGKPVCGSFSLSPAYNFSPAMNVAVR